MQPQYEFKAGYTTQKHKHGLMTPTDMGDTADPELTAWRETDESAHTRRCQNNPAGDLTPGPDALRANIQFGEVHRRHSIRQVRENKGENERRSRTPSARTPAQTELWDPGSPLVMEHVTLAAETT